MALTLLMWILRHPTELGAAIDHPHLHLEDQRRLPTVALRVLHRLIPFERRAHERHLDTPLYALLIWPPEALRQDAAPDAAVDLCRNRQFGQLHDRGVDHVRRCDVLIPLAPLEVGAELTKQGVVLHKPARRNPKLLSCLGGLMSARTLSHRSSVQASTERLLQHQLDFL